MPNAYETARLYELLIRELADFAVFLIDTDGVITTWNPGVERFFGYPETDFVGRHFRDIFTPEDRATGAPEKEMDTARRCGRSDDVRWHLCSDGSRVFVEGVLAAIKDESEQICGFSKIARAVRPQQTAGSMIATLLEGTDDIIYAADRDGRFVFANTHAARLLGRSVDDLIGHTRNELMPLSVAADLNATDESVMRGRHPRLVEEKYPTEGEGRRVILATKAPWVDPGGQPIGVVTIAKDITIRTEHYQERERLLREVRRSNEELSEFSHVVAHDLRAPLRSITTYSQLLARHLSEQMDPADAHFMTFITEAAGNMERLIESLLRYAESTDELTTTQVSVKPVIESVVRQLAPIIREADATITTGPLPEIDADPDRLLQVFQNLIVNAINYRSDDPPRIHISASVTDEGHQFGVADNGVGISREYFERIFAPLKRLDSNKVPGSGIGLALCRRIVERHGGRIWVESEPQKGSTFYFTIPVTPIRALL